MRKMFPFFLVLIIISITFYSIFPKYRFHYTDAIWRTNIITGRVEGYSNIQHKWITLRDKDLLKLKNEDNLKLKWQKVINDPRYKDASPEEQNHIKEDWFKNFIELKP